ncbi:MAG: acyl-CoA dehydrogenase family protein [Candidatus Lokiarchaeota archaeon]|nr:acyl-CoA dehydrogenase family protein [Candidatus Harpocratesius repetitus]
MVDYNLLPYQQELLEKARAFTKEHITPHAVELDRADEIPMDLLQKAYEAGLMNLHIPKEAGGPGYSLLDETLVSESTGYGDAGCATAIMCNNLAFAPLVIGATIEQLQKYIKPLITGEKVKLGAFCLTEREAGSDAAATKTMAVKEGDEWVINGRKCWITNSPKADIFTVFAQTDPSKGYKGMAVFMVPKSAGVEIGHIENKIGQKASAQAEVIFENVYVPEDCLVGEVGKGFHIAMKTLDKTRAGIAAIASGVAQRCVDEASKFAITRKQFGTKIAKFQGIGFMLADMQARALAAHHLTRYAAWLADNHINNSTESAIAKFVASDNAMQNAIDAIQIMGGYGYAEEYGMGVIFRGAKLLQIYEGTNQVQRLVVMSNLKKRAKTLDTGFKLHYDGVDAPDHTWLPEERKK